MMNRSDKAQMLAKLKARTHELKELCKAYENADDAATMEALEKAIDDANDDWCRDLGLSENEIARINRESEAAVDAQINAEIDQTIAKLNKRRGKR
jgi:hypothetical protein